MLTKARIRQVRSLSDKTARSENGLFVAEGRKMVGEALAAGADIERIYLTGEEGAGGVDEAVRCGIVERVSDSEMERMSHLKTPSDMLAVIRMPADGGEAAFPAGELSLCLDGVQDPGNLGTIIRIADWFGIGRVFCSPDSADCYNPKAVQATMGALFRVSVGYGPLDSALAEAAVRGEAVYGTFLGGDDLYRAALCRGHHRHGKRRTGYLPAGRRAGEPETLHSAISVRAAWLRIAERSRRDGYRMRRVP